MQQVQHQDYQRLIAPVEDDMMQAVWSVTQNAEDAEEALQEALTVIWRKLARIRRHPNPRALILRICLNSACDVVRKKVRRREREARAELLTPKPGRSPSEEAVAKEHESLVFRAIGQLSRNQAAAIVLRLVQGQSYPAIADVLGCADATARKHVDRGRKRLRELLGPDLLKEATP
ncbi:MAG: RNA polymerase sigma factor [bacterium]|nr:RNA polymerase sigma factor [bacterium]